ncbi:MAG: P-loop NTPase family protein [Planctomycetota bacterium]|jgi:MinD-like ATPase involved in chromosome partitioning or flagellar assembly
MPPDLSGRPPGAAALDGLLGIADIVWSALDALGDPQLGATLAFAAPRAGAGNTVLSAAAARYLARLPGAQVCLVETDIEHPALAHYLGLHETGLTDVLDGRAPLEEALQECSDRPGLLVLPAGTRRAVRPQEFEGENMQEVLGQVESLSRFLVIDAPPLLEQVEAFPMLQLVDGIVLVLSASLPHEDDAARAQRILSELGTPLLGSILNRHTPEQAIAPRAVAEPVTEPSDVTADASPPDAHLGAERDPDSEHMPPGAGDSTSELQYQRQIEIMERRIAKLSRLLVQTEDNLRALAAQRDVDPGVPSIYRTVRGLSSEEDALEFKRKLMHKIFLANLDLKKARTKKS